MTSQKGTTVASEKIFGMYSFDDEPTPTLSQQVLDPASLSAISEMSKIYYSKNIVEEWHRQMKLIEEWEKTAGSAIDPILLKEEPVSETAKAMEKEEKKVARWWDRFRERKRHE